eukprot:2959725-Prorocentrum_lima.AAC.1
MVIGGEPPEERARREGTKVEGAGEREMVVESVRGEEGGGHRPGQTTRGDRRISHNVVNAARGVKHM